VPSTPWIPAIPEELVNLIEQHESKRKLEVCFAIGKQLTDLRDNSPDGIYGNNVLSTIIKWLELRTRVKLPLSTAHLYIRIAAAFDKKDIRKLATISVWTADQLRLVEDKAKRDLLVRDANKLNWSSRDLYQAILAVRGGYARSINKADPPEASIPKGDRSKKQNRKFRSARQPSRNPRVGIRDFLRLTETLILASQAWVRRGDNAEIPILSEFNSRYPDLNTDVSKLQTALNAIFESAETLHAIVNRLDIELAQAEREEATKT
jgi:hypothetical protein